MTKNLLQSSKHGVIIEGSPLYHDMLSQISGVRYLDNLVQSIFYDGVGKTCGDIRHGSAFLLGLLNIGVHKYGTTGAKVCGSFRKKGFLREVNHIVSQGLGKGLQEGTATGGAGLVQLHIIHGTVLDMNTLHILTADIQNTIHLRLKEGSGIVMGNGFHLSLIQLKGGL